MDTYDVLIIGAATSGAYFAKKMAEKGYSVKVIERLSKENLGKRLDIFHVRKADIKKFGLPSVKEGDPEWAFEFSKGYTAAPSGKYPKLTADTIVGLHMAEYIALMNRQACEKGAEIEYSADFQNFLFENGKICGVRYLSSDGTEKETTARVVVDCSGISSEPRRKLPADYGVESFALTPEDMFYVVLKYVKFDDKNDPKIYEDGKPISIGFPFFKSWIAPCADPEGAIIGIGACHSYAYAESVYERFEKNVPIPKHTITRIERGTTPYTRAPFSFVADNYIVTGDAGCLTKPLNGEGVTSSMVQMEIAVEVLDRALQKGDTSKSSLWDINALYNKGQGADFASLRAAVITLLPNLSQEEFEHVFKSGIITDKLLTSFVDDSDVKLSTSDVVKLAFKVIGAILTGRIKFGTLKGIKKALAVAGALKKLYTNFPTSPDTFEEWVEQTEELWLSVGKMA